MSGSKPSVEMSSATKRGLLAFFGVYLLVASLMAWTAWNAQPVSDPAAAVAGPLSGTAPLRIDSITPAAIIPGDDPAGLLVYGNGFGATTSALVNGAAATTSRYLSSDLLYVELSADEQSSSSRLAISARSADSIPANSNAVIVISANRDRTTVLWRAPLVGMREISQETRFLLLVLLMGSIGGTVASLNSIGIYRGESRLHQGWATHYLVSPVVAGGVVLFLYFAVRAGFLSGTAVTIEPGALPWGLLAVSALGGLFYDRAFLKLREVFLTLFRTPDKRSGKLDPADDPEGDDPGPADPGDVDDDEPPAPPPEITTTGLPDATVGKAYEATVETPDATEAVSWSVTPELPGGLQLHPGTGTISGTPVAAAPKATYVFAAENLTGAKSSVSLDLEVKP